ncbi:MAG: hypothetical protein KA052_03475 [Candidatus Pacebacteria bacterium]|nr:hypothetical protein [Candidatus Paceibacterota bacterium]
MSIEFPQNQSEKIKKVTIVPEEKFASKLTPIYTSEITDPETGEDVGSVDFQLKIKEKKMIVQHIYINKPRQGYGVSTYRMLRDLYPDYTLNDSGEAMRAKDNPEQELANAEYLWKKLVQLGDAEEIEGGGYRMKIK